MSRKLFLLFISIIFSQVVLAQDPVLTLTLKEALRMGMDSSKSLKISSSKLQLAEARYNQALDATYPSVRLSANYTRLSDVDEPKFLFPGATEAVSFFPVYVNNYSAGITISETIFSGFRLKYARDSQQLLRDAASFENENDKNAVAFAIVQSFFNLYKLKVSAIVVRHNLDQIKQRVHETQLAQKNGIVTKNDVLRWQLQQTNTELALLDLENNIDVANFNFNLMLGLSGEKKIEPDTNAVNEVLQQKNLDEYFSMSAKNRKDAAAAGLRSQAAFNVLKVAQNSYLPRVSIAGEFLDARPNARYIPPVDRFNNTWSAGVSFNWDLVSLYTNRHSVDEARSLYRQSAESYNILNDEIRSEINQNFLLYNQSLKKESVMEQGVEQAAENFRLMDSRYKNSLVMLSELLEANNLLLNAQLNLASAKADIQIAYYKLLKSTGNIN